MAKDTFWFKHDYNARNDERILELRSEYKAEGYGIFWMIIETMAENDNGGVKASLIGGLSHSYGVTKEKLLELIQYCLSIELFYEKNGFYFSKRLDKHKKERKHLSESGSTGATKRWGGYKGGYNNGIGDGNSGGNAEEKREEKKREENIKGVSFDENFEFVIFNDGTKQKLGLDQKALAKMGKTKPHLIKFGSIY